MEMEIEIEIEIDGRWAEMGGLDSIDEGRWCSLQRRWKEGKGTSAKRMEEVVDRRLKSVWRRKGKKKKRRKTRPARVYVRKCIRLMGKSKSVTFPFSPVPPTGADRRGSASPVGSRPTPTGESTNADEWAERGDRSGPRKEDGVGYEDEEKEEIKQREEKHRKKGTWESISQYFVHRW
jgi:hypothetical protein